MRTILSVAIVVGVLGLGAYYYLRVYRAEGASNYRVDKVVLGDMLPTIEATGTLEPEEVVDIGAQVNGPITAINVDYRSNVAEKAILAVVDPLMYEAAVEQAKAALNKALADLKQMKANAILALANLKRDDELLKRGAIATADYDAAVAASDVAKANVGDAEAAIDQAKATLKIAEVNLGYCKITSPVKGTIVDRRVNVGQTVVSAMSASSLFLLAKDLSQMQVWASVNEADIGRIQPGVKVHFTVDAYPDEIFYGEVLQVRLNATMTQNVVTYTVVVTTENKDMKLLPYMTASLKFEIDSHEHVLKVPNAALRWKPQPKQIAPDIRAETLAAMNRPKQADDKAEEKKGRRPAGRGSAASSQAAGSGQPAAAAGQGASLATSAGTASATSPEDWNERMKVENHKDGKTVETAKAAKPAAGQPPGEPLSAQAAAELKEHYDTGRLWRVDGNFVRPIPVKVIATDGTMTEVRAENEPLNENDEIVVGVNVASDNGDDTVNPFAPPRFGKGGSKGK
jgi:HlyD family secretion protein